MLNGYLLEFPSSDRRDLGTVRRGLGVGAALLAALKQRTRFDANATSPCAQLGPTDQVSTGFAALIS